MRLKKVNGTFVVFYKDGEGKTRQRDTRQTNRKDAEHVVKEAGIADLEKAASVGLLRESVVDSMLDRKRTTCEQLVPEWENWMDLRGRGPNTRYTYEQSVKRWLREQKLLGKPVRHIAQEHVSNDVNVQDETLTWATRKARLAAIKSFCEYSLARRLLVEDPSHGVYIYTRDMSFRQKEGKKRQPFTEDEYRRVMAHLDEFLSLPPKEQRGIFPENARFWQAAMPLAYWTGMRLGDICSLQWESIGPDGLIVWTQKKEYRVELPYDDPLLGDGALRDVINDLDLEHDKWVFPKHKAIHFDPTSRTAIVHDFKRWVARSGLKTDKTFHSMRHACVTRLKRAGATLEEIGKIVGHRSEETTKGYAHD